MVGIDTGEPTDGFDDNVRELPDVRADLGNAHLQAAAVAAELVITLDTVKKHAGHVLDKLGAATAPKPSPGPTTRPDQLARRPHRRPHLHLRARRRRQEIPPASPPSGDVHPTATHIPSTEPTDATRGLIVTTATVSPTGG